MLPEPVKTFAHQSLSPVLADRKYLSPQPLKRGKLWPSNCHWRSAPTSPETSLISDRIFLAFDTGRGLAYVQVSGKQRAYLLWTFRNFRSLPLKILNTRQRKLVDNLYRSQSIPEGREFDADSVIGKVDNFIPTLSVPTVALATPITVVIEESMPDISTPIRHSPAPSPDTRFGFPGLARRAGAGAMVALMVVVGWQQSRSRPVVSASTTNAIVPQAGVGNSSIQNHAIDTGVVTAPQSPVPSSSVPSPTLNQQSSGSEIAVAPQVASASPVTATPIPPQEETAKPAVAASPAPASFHNNRTTARQASANRGNNRIATNTPHAITSIASLQDSSSTSMPLRVQISGPPRKIVYPLSPDESTRGKVSLQAVVGYDGKVNQVKVLAGNRLLAAAAARAIREWRYQPFSGNGQQLERETRITVSFISTDVVAVSFPDAAQASR